MGRFSENLREIRWTIGSDQIWDRQNIDKILFQIVKNWVVSTLDIPQWPIKKVISERGKIE